MQSVKFLMFFFILSISACTAQKIQVECTQAIRGNTGHRGRVPRDEELSAAIEGKDFFSVQIKCPDKKTKLEVVSLTVLDYGGQVVLKPMSIENMTDEDKGGRVSHIIHARFEKEENCTVTKPSIKSTGLLTLKVNKKLVTVSIREFEMVMPQ